jgi:hypothetical protein
MKTIRVMGSLLFVVTFASTCFSQTFFCSAFSVTNVYPDTINPSDYQISIQCIAGPNEFVSYPFVPTLLDCNGDTVATGGMFYFGQLGQTTQDYPVTLTGNGDITCYPLTASFIINYEPGFTDTCQLSYGINGLETTSEAKEILSIYPNPVNDVLCIEGLQENLDGDFKILNTIGQVVMEDVIAEKIKIESLPMGSYLIVISNEKMKYTSKFIKN